MAIVQPAAQYFMRTDTSRGVPEVSNFASLKLGGPSCAGYFAHPRVKGCVISAKEPRQRLSTRFDVPGASSLAQLISRR
jgi:hypothetical protein